MPTTIEINYIADHKFKYTVTFNADNATIQLILRVNRGDVDLKSKCFKVKIYPLVTRVNTNPDWPACLHK